MTASTAAPLRSAGAVDIEMRSVRLVDPLVRPMLADLAHEYSTRYRGVLDEDQIRAEFEAYPSDEFTAPDGDLVLGLRAGVAIAGGAFRRLREPELGDALLAPPTAVRPGVRTAELKRIWTDAGHRRQGLARTVLTELERRALARGYERVYLTTGPRQPEATALYLSAGYTALFDTTVDLEQIGLLPFAKWLCP